MNLLFFDVDGTLLVDGERKVRKNVIDRINQIDRSKNVVYICTGRNLKSGLSVIGEINIDGFVGSNGQTVYIDNELVYRSFFNAFESDQFLNMIKEYDLVWGYETESGIRVPEGENAHRLAGLIRGHGFVDVEVSNEYLYADILQFWLFSKESIAKFDELKAKGELVNFHAYRWSDEAIEIVGMREDKFNGIREVQKRYLAKEITTKVYCFGDGFNDVNMLKYADVSVAMGNACEEAKEVATIVADNVEDGGLIKVLDELGI